MEMLPGIVRGACRAAALVMVLVLPATARADEPEVPPGKGSYIGGAPAELSPEEAARELANPNTPLASLTLKNQWTGWGGDLPGADGANSGTFLFQPSFPFPVSKTGTIFCRPALPYLVDQPVVSATGEVEPTNGFGDMGMDLAFGRTTSSGVLLTAGMLAGFPTGQDGLSSDTWTLGPEFLVGHFSKKSVLGVFPSHQWDLSGPKDVSLTSIQPILAYLPGGGWGLSSSGPISYNWLSEQWTVPLQLMLSRTVKVGKTPIKLALEGTRYVEQADALGQDWMIGFNITPVVPNVLAK
jgi:hypothetical protein